MMSRRGAAAFCWALLSWLSFVNVFVAAQSKPDSVVTAFKNLPARLFFFDDTDVALYLDPIQRTVYVSHDEGRSWKQAEGIPDGKALMVYAHPHDNRYAFVLTAATTHYRTEDRGKTWRPFDVPAPPAPVAQPLSFHSDLKKYGYILYQGIQCEGVRWAAKCRDHTYYTKEAFSDDVKMLLPNTTRCQFAHSTKDFKHDAHEDLIFCVSFDKSDPRHTLDSSRLYSSTDFFSDNVKIEEFGIGRNAKGVVAFAIVSKFAVAALKDLHSRDGEMLLFVSVDAKTWAKAHFPHASSAKLRENAYTLLESTTHSLAVDVVLQDKSTIGTLFISNSNGTFFVETLKDTNRNSMGYVDYERIYGVEGIGMANYVNNAAEVEGGAAQKKLRTMITFNDGSSWADIPPPTHDIAGQKISCDPSLCALHFHSVTTPHNFGRVFSSPAPGFVMGVGSVGESLWDYENSDTFLSTDAGVTWKMVAKNAHKYEFGDLGSILVIVDDEEVTDVVKYSLDLGQTWISYDIGVKLRARALITLPDSTSQKFLLLGQASKKDETYGGGAVIVFLDFSKTRGRKCQDSDFERWYARPHNSKCLMGHKQWYNRRKPDANCYVGEKYRDPVTHEDNCECTDADYECDFNFIRQDNGCVAVGPEPIPAGICNLDDPDQTYKGSSGWRKVPGNTCEGGIKKDEKVDKKCSMAQPPAGNVIHQTFEFQAQVAQHSYFKEAKTILVRLTDYTVWQSSNEGYLWKQLYPGIRFLGFYHHKYAADRAYLITDSNKFYYTTDTGRTWNIATAPNPPNTFGAQVLHFHPNTDLLIWTGDEDCDADGPNCRTEAHYSRDNGRNWYFVESYVRNCAFVKDAQLDADPTEIVCESYRDKKGSQKYFGLIKNPMELVVGRNYFEKATKRRLFESVVGFTKFSEFLVVAEILPSRGSLELQVSLDGNRFSLGQFPPSMHPETHAYTVLESSTSALFLHMTMSEFPAPFWGTILKSNSNGTYFGISMENVNRDRRGYVDFEKMIGLDGIALINVVVNPGEATVTGSKELQSRITHNDGSTWRSLTPPLVDSNKQEYECGNTKCSLHVHGYTERNDPRATYSTPSVPGLIMAVGNVGEKLAAYKDCDTFLSRDAGFTWQEVHKDAHLWEFGDSGSILVMANDEEPTSHVLFSTDEGLNWREYQFSSENIRVNTIVTVPSDTSRKFILLGSSMRVAGTVAVHLDFSALTSRQCDIDSENPGNDDFEMWSPSEDRPEECLFGRHTQYHRRVRDTNCVVGDKQKVANKIVRNCPCTQVDFECEFNYVKNSNDECVLVPGTSALPDDQSCKDGEEYWYERTPYRLIPYSTCVEGTRRDRGKAHRCPGFKSKGPLFWFFILLLPFGFTGLVGYYYFRRSGMARGTIRLPGEVNRPAFGGDTGFMATLASVPWFIVGITGIAYHWTASRVDTYFFQSRRSGYRDAPIDEDAQILRFEDEES